MVENRKRKEKGKRRGRVEHRECDSEGEREQHREGVQGSKSGREYDSKGVREKENTGRECDEANTGGSVAVRV